MHDAFFKTNKTKMTEYTNMYLERHVKLSFQNRGGSIEEKAVRALQQAFGQELADGKVSRTNLKLSAFVFAGCVDEHEVIPGLLSASYMARESTYWRKGLTSQFRKESSEEAAVAVRNIARASIYLSSRLKNRESTLRALQLFHQTGRKDLTQEKLKPVEAFGRELHLPRPFQAINFAGAEIENYKRADVILKVCLRLSLDAPLWVYAEFDGTYLARALDMSPAGTTYDDVVRCVGPSCEFKGADDRSTQRYADVMNSISTTLKTAKTAGAAEIVSNNTLGSEVFEVFIQSACHRLYLAHLYVINTRRARVI